MFVFCREYFGSCSFASRGLLRPVEVRKLRFDHIRLVGASQQHIFRDQIRRSGVIEVMQSPHLFLQLVVQNQSCHLVKNQGFVPWFVA